ncbi:MAG TPA: LptF/LptG family permease [Pirellulales bacterium]|jgi:lipopolysaccharide export system permease protein
MKIIDRYILRQFLHVFVICLLSLNGLYAVLDAFSHLDEFMKVAESEGGLARVMGEFYLYRSISMFERLAGVLSMVAAMFSVAWIQRHNEMTALLAAGVSRTRVVRPVVGACIAISLITAAGREFVIPPLRDKLSRTSQDLTGKQARDLRPLVDNQTNIMIRGVKAHPAERRIEKPSFMLPLELAQRGSVLSGADAFYEPAAVDHPAGYRIKGVTEPAGLTGGESLHDGNQVVIITPRDGKTWLAPDECFVASDITFEQLTGGQQWQQFASTPELVAGLRNPSLDFGAGVRVSIHARLLQPVFDITLLFLGLPLILAREGRNIFLSIGMCVGVVCVFASTVLACQYLGTIYMLSPALAVWLPLMFYIPLAVAMYENVRR